MASLLKSRRAWVATAAAVAGLLWFAVLRPPSAYRRGVQEAYADHRRGCYEEKVYGLPYKWEAEYRRLLWEGYGVKVTGVAGCCVSEEVIEYARGYNGVCCQLMIQRYGRDIFAECLNRARQKWEAKHAKR